MLTGRVAGAAMSLCILSTSLVANSLVITFDSGDAYCWPLTENQTAGELRQDIEDALSIESENIELFLEDVRLEDEFQLTSHYYNDVRAVLKQDIPKKTYQGYRNYTNSVTASEFSNIHFILKTMATKTLAGLLKYKSELEETGDRVDHVHPLKFLTAVFTSEELKVHIHNIKKRGSWIWGEFFKGLKGSLQEESEIGNLNEFMILDFAANVKIDFKLIQNDLLNRHWDDFIKTLLTNIPREGDSGRYDQ